jgi:hypothetical protein
MRSIFEEPYIGRFVCRCRADRVSIYLRPPRRVRRTSGFGVDKGRELRDQSLSDGRYDGTFDDFTVGDGFAVQRFVAGVVWFQSGAVEVEAGERSFGVAEEQNLRVRVLVGGFPIPHAAEASEPIVKRSDSSFERRSMSRERITTSIFSPPTCTPTLPPSSVTAAGADQFSPLRQEMNPRPKLTPTTAAPFLNPGMTATQSALANSSDRMPWCPEESVSLSRTPTDL